MEMYARYNPEVVSLSQGIPFRHSDFRIRYSVIEALLQNKVDFYSDPQGMLLLREAVSLSLEEEGMRYTPEEILVTAGVTEGLTATFLTLLTPQRNEVLIPTPSYSAYFRIVQIAKGKSVSIPLDESRGWELDRDFLEKNISKRSAAILLCNPNNPTGSIYSRKTLQQVCQIALKYNLFVIVDEVYKNMLFDDVDFYSPATESSFKENLIRVVSFSKDFALTGWRVGFLHTQSKLLSKILPVHDALVNCVPVISQYAAMSALANQESILAENKVIYTKQREKMKFFLDQMQDKFTYTLPKGAYFFFPRVLQEKNVANFCKELLYKANVAVVPGSDFGLGGEEHIRLCFGRREEEITQGMERITQYIRNVR